MSGPGLSIFFCMCPLVKKVWTPLIYTLVKTCTHNSKQKRPNQGTFLFECVNDFICRKINKPVLSFFFLIRLLEMCKFITISKSQNGDSRISSLVFGTTAMALSHFPRFSFSSIALAFPLSLASAFLSPSFHGSVDNHTINDWKHRKINGCIFLIQKVVRVLPFYTFLLPAKDNVRLT